MEVNCIYSKETLYTGFVLKKYVYYFEFKVTFFAGGEIAICQNIFRPCVLTLVRIRLATFKLRRSLVNAGHEVNIVNVYGLGELEPRRSEYRPNHPNATHISSLIFNIGVLWAFRPVNGAL